jgi:hypothetical protein
VPNASSNYDDFISIGIKKSMLTGMHGHGFCCEKGKMGKYMCRLVFKQDLHTWNTCPLLIILFRLENIAKKQHADVRAYPMDEPYGSKHDMSKMHIIVKKHHNYQYYWLCK